MNPIRRLWRWATDADTKDEIRDLKAEIFGSLLPELNEQTERMNEAIARRKRGEGCASGKHIAGAGGVCPCGFFRSTIKIEHSP